LRATQNSMFSDPSKYRILICLAEWLGSSISIIILSFSFFNLDPPSRKVKNLVVLVITSG